MGWLDWAPPDWRHPARLSQVGDERKELIALRELKEDVERREKAQAEVISNQAKRLEELESLYKDEAIMRKKIHNQVGVGVCGGVYVVWVCESER